MTDDFSGEICPPSKFNYSSPESHGVNRTILEGITPYLKRYFPAYSHIIIIKNGSMIFDVINEKSYEQIISKTTKLLGLIISRALRQPSLTFIDKINDTYNLRSVTKSIISLLVGISIDKGLLHSLDEKVHSILSLDVRDHDGKEQITIRHLLEMTSGLASIENFSGAKNMLLSNGDWVDFIWKTKTTSAPGEKFEYNTANTHLLSAVISKVSGISTLEFAKRYLFDPLGIKEMIWEKDKKGIYFGGGNLFMTPYDMAKIGYLCLHQGTWNGVTVLSNEWIQKMLVPYRECMYEYRYGFLWYVKEEECEISHQKHITYSASGAGGQKVFIIPDMDIVMVAVSKCDMFQDNSYFIDRVIGKFVFPADLQ
jgi:Beta-lactamase class C and other penicillin binding proteins